MATTNLNGLYAAVLTLFLVGVLIAVGVTVLGNLGDNVKTSEPVTAETITIASSTGLTTNDDVTSVTLFTNVSTNVDCTTFNGPTACVNWTADGRIYVADDGAKFNISDGDYNISYVYDMDSTATTQVDNTITAVVGFVTWFTIIVVIMVAAIIIGLVMRSFGGR